MSKTRENLSLLEQAVLTNEKLERIQELRSTMLPDLAADLSKMPYDEAIELLKEVENLSFDFYTRDNQGRTLLHLLSSEKPLKPIDIIPYLIKTHYMLISPCDKVGRTALHYAVEAGNEVIVAILLIELCYTRVQFHNDCLSKKEAPPLIKELILARGDSSRNKGRGFGELRRHDFIDFMVDILTLIEKVGYKMFGGVKKKYIYLFERRRPVELTSSQKIENVTEQSYRFILMNKQEYFINVVKELNNDDCQAVLSNLQQKGIDFRSSNYFDKYLLGIILNDQSKARVVWPYLENKTISIKTNLLKNLLRVRKEEMDYNDIIKLLIEGEIKQDALLLMLKSPNLSEEIIKSLVNNPSLKKEPQIFLLGLKECKNPGALTLLWEEYGNTLSPRDIKTLLQNAIEYRNILVCKFLLNKIELYDRDTALLHLGLAIEKLSPLEIVKLIWSKGKAVLSDDDIKHQIRQAIKYSSALEFLFTENIELFSKQEIVEILEQIIPANTIKRNTELVLNLLGKIDKYDDTNPTLYKALSNNAPSTIIEELLKKYECIRIKVQEKNTVLHIAIKNQYSQPIIELLYNKLQKSDITLRNTKGETVLHTACKARRLDIIKYLLPKFLNINHVDNRGNTVLHTAAKYCRYSDGEVEEVFQMFLDKGLNLNMHNNMGRTPSQEARGDLKTYLDQKVFMQNLTPTQKFLYNYLFIISTTAHILCNNLLISTIINMFDSYNYLYSQTDNVKRSIAGSILVNFISFIGAITVNINIEQKDGTRMWPNYAVPLAFDLLFNHKKLQDEGEKIVNKWW